MASGISPIRTWLDICNSALLSLGTETITSLTDGSTNQGYCSVFLPEVVSDVLDEFEYQAAKKRLQLAAIAETPLWDYDYKFPFPSDFLRLVEVNTNGIDYTVEGNAILTNAVDVFILYEAMPDLPTKLSTYIVNAITACLALKLIEPVCSDDSLYPKILTRYENAMKKAVVKESNNNQETELYDELGFTWYDELR